MRLVVDANALFSALIKDSISSELLLSDELEICAPDFILEELEKHRPALLSKTHRSNEDFEELLWAFKESVKFLDSRDLSGFLDDAKRLSPDPNDAAYFAAAIALGAAIWSNDKALKKQDKIRVYTTDELLRML